MASSNTHAFDRLLPTKSLYAGRSLVGTLVSTAAILLLCAMLLCGWMLVDLLDTRGKLDADAAAVLADVYTTTVAPAEDAPEDAEPETVTAAFARPGDNRGLLPTVARMRAGNHLGASAMTWLVRTVPSLRSNSRTLVTLLAVGFGLAIGWAILRRLAWELAHRTAMETATRLRRSLHRHALRLGPGDLRNDTGTTTLELFTREVDIVHDGVLEICYRQGRHLVEIVVLVLFALAIDPLLTLECLVPLALCWFLVHRELRRRIEQRRLDEDRAAAELQRLAEGLRNTRLVRGYGMENVEHQTFAAHLERYQRETLAVERGDATTRWALRVLVAFCLGLVFFLVGLKVLAPSGSLSLAGAVALLVAFGWTYPALERLGGLSLARARARASADLVQRYLDELPEVSQAVGAKFLEPLARELRFENVTYRTRDGRTVLDGLDLTVRAGGVVAVVSLDPIEARAAAYMLPRFVEPTSGRVVVDGEDIAWVTLESLRAETIFVGGGDLFFTGTVAENISCGSAEFDVPAITEAAKTVHAHNFVTRLPKGYETVLGERGEQLNAGQAFRLGLARAIVRNPALLIVEEPDALLDGDTKSMLDDAYDRILSDRTVILLPTRLSTLRRANRVVVLQNGRVVADGHHNDLVKASPLYRHWEYVRFNEFRRTTD